MLINSSEHIYSFLLDHLVLQFSSPLCMKKWVHILVSSVVEFKITNFVKLSTFEVNWFHRSKWKSSRFWCLVLSFLFDPHWLVQVKNMNSIKHFSRLIYTSIHIHEIAYNSCAMSIKQFYRLVAWNVSDWLFYKIKSLYVIEDHSFAL